MHTFLHHASGGWTRFAAQPAKHVPAKATPPQSPKVNPSHVHASDSSSRQRRLDVADHLGRVGVHDVPPAVQKQLQTGGGGRRGAEEEECRRE